MIIMLFEMILNLKFNVFWIDHITTQNVQHYKSFSTDV